MKRPIAPPWHTLALAVLLAPIAAPALAQGDASPPAWYREHNEFMTRGGGVFHTDNSRHRSATEPWDQYGLAWEKGPSGQTVHGRLFGLRDGVDGGTFWEFWVYWHPGDGKAYIVQVGGDGTLGVGTLEPPGANGKARSEATFHHPDGTSTRVAHEVENAGDTHATASFDWVDGAWQPRRTYVWTRVGAASGGEASGTGDDGESP